VSLLTYSQKKAISEVLGGGRLVHIFVSLVQGDGQATLGPILLRNAKADVEKHANCCIIDERVGQVDNRECSGF